MIFLIGIVPSLFALAFAIYSLIKARESERESQELRELLDEYNREMQRQQVEFRKVT